jgi:hypothetical protein
LVSSLEYSDEAAGTAAATAITAERRKVPPCGDQGCCVTMTLFE